MARSYAELQRLLDAPAHGLATLANGVWPTRALFMRSHTTLRLRNASLVTIGDFAFHDGTGTVDLRGLTGLVTIGDRAFYRATGAPTGLEGLTSLVSIGDRAFFHATGGPVDLQGLTSLAHVGEGAFGQLEVLRS